MKFRAAWSLAILSRIETPRRRTLAGGASAPATAVRGAGGAVTLENTGEAANPVLMDFERADLAATNDGLRGAAMHRPGHGAGKAGFDMTPQASRGAFKAAHRHSALVKLLRRAAIGGSLVAVALISAALLNPLRRLPVNVSISHVGVEGKKITVDSPKITGVQNDGRPFDIQARSGIQDITSPNIIELHGVDSKLGSAKTSTTWVRAAKGVYDSLHDKMTLDGDIQIKSSAGYDILLNTARIDFKTGGLISRGQGPVKVLIDGGTIVAKQLDVSDNGHKVSFGGDVTSKIDSGTGEPKPADTMVESVR